VSDNTDGLPDPTAPYATVMRLIRAHCHPEVEQQAYAALCARAAAADPADTELGVFKAEMRRLLTGELSQLPAGALDAAAEYHEGNDEEFLRRLWRDLYGDAPIHLGYCWYYPCQAPDAPVVLHDGDDIHAMLVDLPTQPASHRFATIHLDDRPRWTDADLSPTLGVGAHPHTGVVALTYTGTDGAGERGTWVSYHPTGPTGQAGCYVHFGEERKLPPMSEVPLATARLAILGFLTFAGSRPDHVRWQNP
jgi:Immunity protein Imm1